MKKKVLAMLIGLASLALLGVACSDDNSTPASIPIGSVSGSPGEFTSLGSFSGSGISTMYGDGRSGIWVTGVGQVSAQPDLFLLNLGVESRGDTVAEARGQAAAAMARIMDTLESHGIEEMDIQTQQFNIRPEYVYKDVFEQEVRYGVQELVGYTVTNTVRIKIRDLEDVGPIIDDTTSAGGNLTRINGISFTVEDSSQYAVQARELAVMDAMSKAKQFAKVADVQVGPLAYITEISGGSPVVARDAAASFIEEAAFAPTSISAGELEVRVVVQAAFVIQ